MTKNFLLPPLLLSVMVVGGCASFTRDAFDWSFTETYRHNAIISVETLNADGKKISEIKDAAGIAVVPRGDAYNIRVKSIQDMDYVLFRTCGRDRPMERKGDDLRLELIPNDVEKECANEVQILGFERDLNRPTFGRIIIADPRYRLPFTLNCDGDKKVIAGTGVCHMAEGLEARIEFESKVFMTASTEECGFHARNESGADDLQNPTEGRKFFLKPFPKKPCEMQFLELGGERRRADVYLKPYKRNIVLGKES